MDSKKAKREIISLALLLEDVSHYGVHFRFSGHVNELTVEIYPTKKEFENALLYEDFHCDFRYSSDGKNYLKIRSFLEEKIKEETPIKEKIEIKNTNRRQAN